MGDVGRIIGRHQWRPKLVDHAAPVLLKGRLEAAQFLDFLEHEAPVTIARFHRNFEADFERDELDDFLSVASRAGLVAVRVPEPS